MLWGTRVLIHDKLRSTFLDEHHEGHQGIVKMKFLARLHFWWPNPDKEIEDVVRKNANMHNLLQLRLHAMPGLGRINHGSGFILILHSMKEITTL